MVAQFLNVSDSGEVAIKLVSEHHAPGGNGSVDTMVSPPTPFKLMLFAPFSVKQTAHGICKLYKNHIRHQRKGGDIEFCVHVCSLTNHVTKAGELQQKVHVKGKSTFV